MLRKAENNRRIKLLGLAAMMLAIMLANLNLPLIQTASAQAGMVRRFDVRIKTANVDGAGTDDPSYIGIGGREFRMGRPGVDDFERGHDDVLIFGESANVDNPGFNDPRHAQMTLANVMTYPIYIRKGPDGSNGEWAIESVQITINPGPGQTVYTRSFHTPFGAVDPMWLRTAGGLTFYIK